MTSDDDREADDRAEEPDVPRWDALDVLRARAAASRAERDAAIADLRESMNDDAIREDFGIDLGEIEG